MPPTPLELGPWIVTAVAGGVAGLFDRFGSSNDGERDPTERIAEVLDADPTRSDIERRLDELAEAVDTLAGAADLDRAGGPSPRPDASPVEKASALARAVRRGDLRVGPPRDGGSETPFSTAAGRLQREQSAESDEARSLLGAAADPDRTDPDRARAVLEEAVGALDERHETVDALGILDGPESAADLADRLEGRRGELVESVRELARTAARAERRAERAESDRKQLADAVNSLWDEFGDPRGEEPPADVTARARALVDAAGRGAIGADDGPEQVADAAARVRRSVDPESGTARDLLDRLATPADDHDLERALSSAARQLDESATNRSVVGDLDRGAVRELLDSVGAAVDDAPDPVSGVLDARLDDLGRMLDRADESNTVVPYAVRQELRFYDRTLIPELSGASVRGGGAGGEINELEGTVADRRAEIEDRYVDSKPDHNHSIPLYFLSLVEELESEAERLRAAGDRERAVGVLRAAEELLDRVEGLYERNEYSVMLRRLRG